MKIFPTIDWQELTGNEKLVMNKYEELIKWYLDMDLWDSEEVLAYNLAFTLLSHNKKQKDNLKDNLILLDNQDFSKFDDKFLNKYFPHTIDEVMELF